MPTSDGAPDAVLEYVAPEVAAPVAEAPAPVDSVSAPHMEMGSVVIPGENVTLGEVMQEQSAVPVPEVPVAVEPTQVLPTEAPVIPAVEAAVPIPEPTPMPVAAPTLDTITPPQAVPSPIETVPAPQPPLVEQAVPAAVALEVAPTVAPAEALAATVVVPETAPLVTVKIEHERQSVGQKGKSEIRPVANADQINRAKDLKDLSARLEAALGVNNEPTMRPHHKAKRGERK